MGLLPEPCDWRVVQVAQILHNASYMQQTHQTQTARDSLDNFLGKFKSTPNGSNLSKAKRPPCLLHCQHVKVFEAVLMLMNCSTAIGDFLASAKHCKGIVEMLRVPPNGYIGAMV